MNPVATPGGKMKILFVAGDPKPERWTVPILEQLPDAEVYVWNPNGPAIDADYAIVWQPPERSKMFKYDVYGYERNATLLTEIKAPMVLPPGPVSLQAKTSWMACNDSSCNPGYHTFDLKLSTGEKTVWDSRTRKLIAQTRSLIPKPLPKLRARMEPKGNKMRVLVEGDAIAGLQPGPELHFFSSLNHYKVDARQKIRINKSSVTITLTKTDYAPDKIDRVEGVLQFLAKRAGSKGSSHALIQAKLD